MGATAAAVPHPQLISRGGSNRLRTDTRGGDGRPPGAAAADARNDESLSPKARRRCRTVASLRATTKNARARKCRAHGDARLSHGTPQSPSRARPVGNPIYRDQHHKKYVSRSTLAASTLRQKSPRRNGHRARMRPPLDALATPLRVVVGNIVLRPIGPRGVDHGCGRVAITAT